MYEVVGPASNLLNVVHRVLGVRPAPPHAVVLATAAVALVAVLWRPAWRITRNFITIAHEGGHALVAVLTGRRLSAIRLHSDTSGLTVSRGRPHGPGMVLTGLAGYPTPPLLGLGAAALLGVDRLPLVLWTGLVLLPLMLIMIRNVYGVLSIVATMAILGAVAWYAGPGLQGAFGYLLAWFLLFGGLRATWELQGSRRRGTAPNSDADQAARLTRVPAILFVGLFLAVAVGCLALGGSWLLKDVAGWWPAH